MTDTHIDDDRRTDTEYEHERCDSCGDDLLPGERVVRVESGEQTPYGMAPADASYGSSRRYHEDCLPDGFATGAVE